MRRYCARALMIYINVCLLVYDLWRVIRRLYLRIVARAIGAPRDFAFAFDADTSRDITTQLSEFYYCNDNVSLRELRKWVNCTKIAIVMLGPMRMAVINVAAGTDMVADAQLPFGDVSLQSFSYKVMQTATEGAMGAIGCAERISELKSRPMYKENVT